MSLIQSIKDKLGNAVRNVTHSSDGSPEHKEETYTTEVKEGNTVHTIVSNKPPKVSLTERINAAQEKHKAISASVIGAGEDIAHAVSDKVRYVQKQPVVQFVSREVSAASNSNTIKRFQKSSVRSDASTVFRTIGGVAPSTNKSKKKSISTHNTQPLLQSQQNVGLMDYGGYNINAGFSSKKTGKQNTMNGYDVEGSFKSSNNMLSGGFNMNLFSTPKGKKKDNGWTIGGKL